MDALHGSQRREGRGAEGRTFCGPKLETCPKSVRIGHALACIGERGEKGGVVHRRGIESRAATANSAHLHVPRRHHPRRLTSSSSTSRRGNLGTASRVTGRACRTLPRCARRPSALSCTRPVIQRATKAVPRMQLHAVARRLAPRYIQSREDIAFHEPSACGLATGRAATFGSLAGGGCTSTSELSSSSRFLPLLAGGDGPRGGS